MPLVYAPLGLTLGNHGMLLTNLLLDLATAALVFAAARREGGRAAGLIAAAAYLSLPLVFGVLYAKGVTDLVPVTLLLGGLLANERRPFVAGLLFGLSVSSKLLPGLAALPACIPQRGRGVFSLGFVAGLLPTLLAWLSAPRAFVDNILRFNSIRPVELEQLVVGSGAAAERGQPGRVRPRVARACGLRRAVRGAADDALQSGRAASPGGLPWRTVGASKLQFVVDPIPVHRLGGAHRFGGSACVFKIGRF